jgi:hypothetical protein
MGHEDAVYLAKLAEQAERYEGTCCDTHGPAAPVPALPPPPPPDSHPANAAAQRWLRT